MGFYVVLEIMIWGGSRAFPGTDLTSVADDELLLLAREFCGARCACLYRGSRRFNYGDEQGFTHRQGEGTQPRARVYVLGSQVSEFAHGETDLGGDGSAPSFNEGSSALSSDT